VSFIRVLESSYGPDINWIAVSGFTTAGSCPQADGYLALMLRDDTRGKQMLRLAEAARLANAVVTVNIDDTHKSTAGYCLVQYISVAQ